MVPNLCFLNSIQTVNLSLKDTLEVQGNQFSATYPYDANEPLNYLQVESGRNVVFFVENQDLTITLDKDDAANVQVAGGAVNTAYYDYLGATAGFSEQKGVVRGAHS